MNYIFQNPTWGDFAEEGGTAAGWRRCGSAVMIIYIGRVQRADDKIIICEIFSININMTMKNDARQLQSAFVE